MRTTTFKTPLRFFHLKSKDTHSFAVRSSHDSILNNVPCNVLLLHNVFRTKGHFVTK